MKNRDPKGHWRCKTVAFRVSPEEGQRLDMQVKTSGMLKQDFIIKRLLNDEITVRPNVRIQKYLAEYLTEMTAELKRLETVSESSYILENIRYLLELIDRLSPR
ncbi:plasmid mobilization protein [Candidatus Avoscillospira sp. LCP25S3_F1]|uniref:plasmid mobilization protein n=1 Tax=Candidatus Avoscillospira sp. LCP25S3_F1 TaxID=3438825 RepID=UPI003F93ECAA